MASTSLSERGISRRRFLRTTLAGAGALTFGPVFWRQRAAWAAEPTGVHLTYGADPTSQMSVSWSTPLSTASRLRHGQQSGVYGDFVTPDTRVVTADLPIYQDGSSAYHHVRLTGLSPATTYYYQIEGQTGEFTFETAPSAPQGFTFTSFGDQGYGESMTSAPRLNTSLVDTIDPAFQFHVGDLCYAHTVLGAGIGGPTNQAVWDQWFGMIAPVASRRPWMTTVGNHEMEPGYGDLGYNGYFARFSLPQNGPNGVPVVYSFKYQNDGFIALDANDASYEIPHNQCYAQSLQDPWLEQTLQAFRSDSTIDFIVIGYHHCSYCTNAVHGSDGGVRDRWGALFDEYKVDLVINGHNHCYERTHPIRQGIWNEVVAGTPEDPILPEAHGTVYVTAGGGGSQPYPIPLYPAAYVTVVGGARVPESGAWSAIQRQVNSLLQVDVTPPGNGGVTTMTLKALQPTATSVTVLEQVTLQRTHGSFTPAAVEAPILPFVCEPSI